MSWITEEDEAKFLRQASKPPKVPAYCFGRGQYIERYLRELDDDIEGLSTGWCYTVERGQMMRGIPPELEPESIGKCHARALMNLDALETVIERSSPCMTTQEQLAILGKVEQLRLSIEAGKKAVELSFEFRELEDVVGTSFKIRGMFRMMEGSPGKMAEAFESLFQEASEKMKAQKQMEEEYK